jgi:hypothetical protein
VIAHILKKIYYGKGLQISLRALILLESSVSVTDFQATEAYSILDLAEAK